jgi:hypothetical protein
VAACAQLVGFDRSRNLYPIALIVIASYYELFAAMAGSYSALGREAVPFAAFILLAVLGFRFSLWLVVAEIVAHGLSDAIHLSVIDNPGVPGWWPGFCMSIDLAIGGYAAVRISCVRSANSATAHNSVLAGSPKEQT